MKKILSSLLLFLFIISGAQAKIWRVNNNQGVVANFTTAQAAHDGAAAGDTLHFESSANAYGNLTITKKLVLIGVGDFLGINLNNQASSVSAMVNDITINAGGDNSVIMVSMGGIQIENAQGVIIQRCFISPGGLGGNSARGIVLLNANNTIIRNCLVQSIINLGGFASSFQPSSTNVQIINNILGSITVNSVSSATILNNVISTSGNNSVAINNSTYRNNIINKPATFTFSNSVVENNLASDNTLPAGNGNQNNVNMTNVFIDPNVFLDKNFILKAGSPAIGAGAGGIDAGAFGGTSPYKLSVQPNVPAIYKLVAPAVVTGATITVTISTKSNN